MKKLFLRLFLPAIAVILVLTGCGSSSSNYDSASQSNLAAADYAGNVSLTESAAVSTSSSTDADTAVVQQKLIYKGDINVETKAFDETMDVINRSLNEANGYIMSQEDSNSEHSRYTTIEIRIPSDRFFSWVEGVEQLPDVTLSKNIFTEDVSEEYVDLVARLESKQVVIDKYIEYMQLATTADELIRFTNELAVLQEEIEAVQARIRYLNHQVDYSTLTLYIKEYNERAFFAELKIGSTLKHSFENGITGFVGVLGFIISTFIILLPFVILGLLIWYIIYLVRRNTVKNKTNAYSAVYPPLQAQPQGQPHPSLQAQQQPQGQLHPQQQAQPQGQPHPQPHPQPQGQPHPQQQAQPQPQGQQQPQQQAQQQPQPPKDKEGS